ncbi:Ankyrin repeat domain-containing protein 66 [Merluccius polli]|uniref:Ankyrin repeat domain-containing protein 66 n=1 Tax=Merluccius polli TaxID=89951 RepID=A0AA47N8I8_MERPO|nr:Ankyrin repeat domain-containing protein 66 [Merluccius polli]
MTELHQAAAAGDCDRVEELLKNNTCDPNQRDVDWNHKTPLHWASAKVIYLYIHLLFGQFRSSISLLRLRSCFKTYQVPPPGHTEVVRMLVESGARPCARADHGWTPAHFAAESGRLGVLRMLHALHAPVDQDDVCGDRPIRIAEIYGHEDCVRFLSIAEMESKAYRRTAEQSGVPLDDKDEEREDQQKESGLDVKKLRMCHWSFTDCRDKEVSTVEDSDFWRSGGQRTDKRFLSVSRT